MYKYKIFYCILTGRGFNHKGNKGNFVNDILRKYVWGLGSFGQAMGNVTMAYSQ